MANSISQTKNFSLALPITQKARMVAQQFASVKLPPRKAEQVWLNTIAVCVVNDYLQMMGIPTNLEASDSWHPVVRLCSDVADLEVTGVGRLECRPMKADWQICYVPPEVCEDRVGYIVVQLDEPFREATVLGFTQGFALDSRAPAQTAVKELPITQLQAPEEMLAHLHQLRQSVAVAKHQTPVNLSQWLLHMFESGWQPVEALLAPAQTNLAFSFRGTDNLEKTDPHHLEGRIRGAKVIDLGVQLSGYSVALFLEIEPESAQKTDIFLQVHPTGSQVYLPPLLQLTVLDETGMIFLEAQARRADNYIQLKFSGQPGEQFSVKVALGDVSMTEKFVI
ncbi:MAG: DUF1822 family protein [Chroococcidiopsidaceae cyanobacterium CP_BM_RX_35]|nr:DUF1822 family protein [Chroococcidiopsidaceae cyanobacterium CP_BM_RX_35]